MIMNDTLPSRNAIDGDIDLLVVGSGASGLAAAITAKRLGLNTVIIEKCPVWGGSTAVSSGGIWAPLNSFAKRAAMPDDIEQVRIYLDQTAPRRNPQLSELFLRWVGPALDFFEENSAARFLAAPKYPDYDSEKPGSSMEGRMLWPLPYDGRALGDHFQTLRSPLQHSMLFGGMVVGVAELKIFMRAYRSPKAAWHVLKRIARHAKDRVTASRGYYIANGNALAGRLGQTVFDLKIPLHLSTSLQRLIEEDGRVVGAVVLHDGRERTISARAGVVLAAGGAAASVEWQQRIYSHVKAGIEHHSLVPPGATGDSLRLAGQLAGDADLDPAQPVVWLPVSLVPIGNGKTVPFPSFIDRAKPGFIAVDPGGQRFTNEASSYQEFVPSFLAAAQAYGADKGYTWLIASHAAVRKYGIGAARPFPFRLSPHLKSGYVVSGRTPEELAAKIGVPAHALAATIQRYNENARNGVDPDFGRGTLSYNRHMGDPEHQPNPCVAPLEGRLYAIKLLPGDAGTTFGLKVDENMQVLRKDGSAIAGLYAVGNDIASIFGGGYPGGGATLGPALAFGHLAGRVAAGAERVAHG